MKEQPTIGRSEMEILRYVVDHHPVTVGEVAEHVAETKGLVRTTVLNVMERLRQKGYLTRKKIDGVFHYSPRVPKAELFRNLVRNFVDNALGGNVSPFLAYLNEEASLTESEMSELRKLVQELPNKSNGGKNE